MYKKFLITLAACVILIGGLVYYLPHLISSGTKTDSTKNGTRAPDAHREAIQAPDGSLTEFEKDQQYVYLENTPFLGKARPQDLSKDREFIEGVDVPSFVSVGGPYFKDRNAVYIDLAVQFGRVEGADPATFTYFTKEKDDGYSYPFGKDKARVFFHHNLIEDADPATFTLIPNSRFAKDANYVFYASDDYDRTARKIKGANPNTFIPLLALSGEISVYGKDGMTIYCAETILESADRASFVVIEERSARDNKNHYSSCRISLRE